MQHFYDTDRMSRHRWVNRLQAVLLFGAIGLVLLLCADLIAGPDGAIVVLIIGAIGVVFAPRLRPKAILRLFRAAPIDPREQPSLYRILLLLCRRAGLTTSPQLFWTPDRQTAIFSVGSREDSGIAISQGALEWLNQREMSGVLAHEVAHIASGDLRLKMASEIMGRLVRAVSTFGLLLALFLGLAGQGGATLGTVLVLALAPVSVSLLQLALSRSREFDADRAAVELTGDPIGLASALQKIERIQTSLLRRLLWPYAPGELPVWLRTHPRTEDRVSRLLEGR